MVQRAVTERIAELVTPSLEANGFELVRVMLTGGDRPTLQIMADRADETPITVDDCADISRVVSAILDVEDPIKGTYTLEVSSPGIDRPLVRRKDFERFAGFEAKVETAAPVDGRRRFRGRLLGVDGDDVRLALETGEAAIPLLAIDRAKLVMTDELLAAAEAAQHERN
ncbi:MAG: ribosome maturation factor RimP [Alphaproteobacteria bacterium]